MKIHLRRPDNGSFVIAVTKAGFTWLVPIKDSEVRAGSLASILGSETGAYVGMFPAAAGHMTELVLSLRRAALEAATAAVAAGNMPTAFVEALRSPMAFVEALGSYTIPTEVTGTASTARMVFTRGRVLDPLLDPSAELHALVAFRRKSCSIGADGEARQVPFTFHLHLPAGLERAERLALSATRVQLCVDALARAFDRMPTAAVVKFLSTVGRVPLRAELIDLFGGAAVQVIASAYRACWKSVFLSLTLSACGANSVAQILSGTETTMPIMLEKGNQLATSVVGIDDLMSSRHIDLFKAINCQSFIIAAYDGRPNRTLHADRTIRATIVVTSNSAELSDGRRAGLNSVYGCQLRRHHSRRVCCGPYVNELRRYVRRRA